MNKELAVEISLLVFEFPNQYVTADIKKRSCLAVRVAKRTNNTAVLAKGILNESYEPYGIKAVLLSFFPFLTFADAGTIIMSVFCRLVLN